VRVCGWRWRDESSNSLEVYKTRKHTFTKICMVVDNDSEFEKWSFGNEDVVGAQG
jgi:hypothetical protein